MERDLEDLQVAVGALSDEETARVFVEVQAMGFLEIEDVANELEGGIQQHNTPVVVVSHRNMIVAAQGHVARGVELQITWTSHSAVSVPQIPVSADDAHPMKAILDVERH